MVMFLPSCLPLILFSIASVSSGAVETFDYYNVEDMFDNFVVECGSADDPFMKILYGGEAHSVYAVDAPTACLAVEVAPTVFVIDIKDYTDTDCPVVVTDTGSEPVRMLDVIVQMSPVRRIDDPYKQITCNYGLSGRQSNAGDINAEQGLIKIDPIMKNARNETGADLVSMQVFGISNTPITTATLGSYIQLRAYHQGSYVTICDRGYTLVGSGCYFLSRDFLSLDSANTACALHTGAHLAELEEGEEYEAVMQWLTESGLLSELVWVAGDASAGGWVWRQSGDLIDYGWTSAAVPPVDSNMGVAISEAGTFVPFPVGARALYICEEDSPDRVLTSSIKMQNCRAYEDDVSYYFLIGGCGEGDVLNSDRGFRTKEEDVSDNNITATRVARSAFFKSFLLPDKDTMTFECDYFVCTSIEDCDGYSCSDSFSNDVRRRRSIPEAQKESLLPSVRSQKLKIIHSVEELNQVHSKESQLTWSPEHDDIMGKEQFIAAYLDETKRNSFQHKIGVPTIATSQDSSHMMLIGGMCLILLFLVVLVVMGGLYYRRLLHDRLENPYKIVYAVRPRDHDQDPPAYQESQVFCTQNSDYVNDIRVPMGAVRGRAVSLDGLLPRNRTRSVDQCL